MPFFNEIYRTMLKGEQTEQFQWADKIFYTNAKN